jgi:PAS domain S-box-containing protein
MAQSPSPRSSSRALTLEPDLRESARVRVFLREMAEDLGFSSERVFDIQVAVGEAVANAIEHAHGAGHVTVEAKVVADRFEVSVAGEGDFHPPSQTDERYHRGLGLPLMATLSDRLALYSAAEGGTLVTLIFFLPGSISGAMPPGPTLTDLLAETALLKDLLNSVPDGFYIVDPSWRLVFVNDRLVERTSADRDALLGQVVWEEFPAIDREVRAAFEEAMQKREPVTVRGPVAELGAWREWSAFPVPEGLAVISRDIGEQKRVEQERDRQQEALRESEERFRTTFEQAAVGVAHISREGRYLRVNRRYAEILGYSRDEFAQLTVQELTHPDDLGEDLARTERVWNGELQTYSIEKRILRPDGRTAWVRRTVSLAPASASHPAYLISVLEDIYEQKRAEERAQEEVRVAKLLEEASVTLARSLELKVVLGTLADILLALTRRERVVIALLERSKATATVEVARGGSVVPEGTTLALSSLAPQYAEVVQEQTPRIVDYEGEGVSPQARESAAELRSRLAYLVPLVLKGDTLGFIALDTPGAREPFCERDALLVAGLASQAAVAIENARLYEAQRDIARMLQEPLMTLPSDVHGLEIAHLYRSATESARVGGDFYDLFQPNARTVAFVIGDVCGHGVAAATEAALVRDLIRAHYYRGKRVEKVLRLTNEALQRRAAGYATVFLGVLHLETGNFRYVSAGHPPVMLRRGTEVRLLENQVLPLGILALAEEVRADELLLKEGDELLFYTDGVTEARGGKVVFGEQGLLARLQADGRSAPQLVPTVLEAVLELTGGVLEDDIAMLGVRIEALVKPERA